MNQEPTKKDLEESKKILKTLKGRQKIRPIPLEEDILKWDIVDLNNYIRMKTKGMSIKQKLKFAAELDKRIKREKELKGNK